MFFVDDNITSDVRGIKRFDRLLDAIIDNGLNDMLYITQASSVGMGYKESIVKKMRKAGFDLVFLGIENVSDKSLDFLNKGKIVNYSKRAANYLVKNNISVLGGLVLGSEYDSEEDFKKNIDFLIKSGIDILGEQIVTPYPGTEIRDELIKKDLVTNIDDWTTYNGYFANIKTKNFSSDKLDYLKWKYGNYYQNSRRKNFKKLNVFKNHPFFVLRYFIHEMIKNIPINIKKIGKTEHEKFEIDFQRMLNINKNLI
jgi:radical SAM superfamily enzyme YgiQ (UPF0313 family)